MSEGNENEYIKQLTGSAGANMIFVVAFVLYRALQNRCTKSKSKCATHCGWCDLEIENDSSSSSDIEEGTVKHENARSRMPQVHQSHDRELPTRDLAAIPFDVRKIREPENWGLADHGSSEKSFRKSAIEQEKVSERLGTQGK